MTKVFVTAATGTQSGALISSLLSQSIPPSNIVALSRDPSSPASQRLSSLGIRVTSDPADSAGCDAVFLNLVPDLSDDSAELAQANRLLPIFKASGVKHIVYSSSLACGDPTVGEGDLLYDRMVVMKRAVEDAVKSAGFETWTILRLGTFMSNHTIVARLSFMYPGLMEHGTWRTTYRKESRIALIDPVTIGHFTAAALLDPKKWDGKELNLADEPMGVDKIMEGLSRVSGKKLRVEYIPDEDLQKEVQGSLIQAAHYTCRAQDRLVEFDKLREYGIPMSSFDAFLKREEDAVKTAYADVGGQD